MSEILQNISKYEEGDTRETGKTIGRQGILGRQGD